MKNPTTHGATPGQAAPENSEFHATVVAFAKQGHMLQRQIRADDKRVSFIVSNWGQSRMFSDWHSVQAFLSQIGGRA
jgi:hypothetical protein